MKALLKKALICALGAVLLLSGCSSDDTSWAYRYNGDTISAGMYITFLMDGLSMVEDKDRENNAENTDYETPSIKGLLQVSVDGMTGDAWVRNNAYELAQRYFWINETFDALGLTLTEAEEATARNTTESFWGYYGDYYEDHGVSQASMLQYQLCTAKQSQIFEALYGEGGEFGISDAELRTIFQEKFAKADYLYMSKAVRGSEEQDEATADEYDETQRERAESYVERLESGSSIEDMVYEQRQREAEDSGDEDEVTRPDEGSYTIIVSEDYAYMYGEEFVDAIFSTAVGKAQVVESDSYFLVVCRRDILAEASDFDTYRTTLLNGEKYEEFEAYVEEQSKTISPETNSAAISRYVPSNIKEMPQ